MAGGASIRPLPQYRPEDDDQQQNIRSRALQRSTMVPDNSEHIQQLHAPQEKKKEQDKKPLEGLKKKYLEDEDEYPVIPPTDTLGGY